MKREKKTTETQGKKSRAMLLTITFPALLLATKQKVKCKVSYWLNI